jgi:predicted ATPase
VLAIVKDSEVKTMLRLQQIEIHGFKSIKALPPLELQPLTVLIGANGSGKSNFLGIFKMLNQMVNGAGGRLQHFVMKQGGADFLLHYGQKTTSEMQVRLELADKADSIYAYRASFKPAGNENLFIADEAWSVKTVQGGVTTRPPAATIGSNGNREADLMREAHAKPEDDTNNIAQRFVETFQTWRVYQFHDTGDSSPIKNNNRVDDNEFFRADGGNLAAFLYLLQRKFPQHYAKIIATIQLVAPFFENFHLRPLVENNDFIGLRWWDKNSEHLFHVSQFSDGLLRFICLATLLLQPTLPALIIIDEPELGLHPYAITLLADLIAIASTKTQVIVATQSVTLVNHIDPENLVIVEHRNGESHFTSLKNTPLDNWLEDYSLGEIWEKNVIGGRP